jgi:hypothetical protein
MHVRVQRTVLYTILVLLIVLLLSRTPLSAADRSSLASELQAALPQLMARCSSLCRGDRFVAEPPRDDRCQA